MLENLRQLGPAVICLAILARASTVSAQHLDVLTQDVDGKLGVGSGFPDDENGALGSRVFSQFFPEDFVNSDPGFNAIGSMFGTLPPGSSALPGDSDLSWDFLPMKVGGYASTLLYWNGAGTTSASVAFGPAPNSDYSLSLFGKNGLRAAADGTAALIPGRIIDTTEEDGYIHVHRSFFLDNDHDNDNATVASAGVYLIAMRFRMEGLDRSDPFFIVWGTPGAAGPSATTLAAAKTWVEDRVDLLAPNFSADFDGDLDVDGADFLTWQRGLGAAADALQIQGDADHDHAINSADLGVLRSQLGSTLATFPGASSLPAAAVVPEPAGATVVLVTLFGLLGLSRRGFMRQIRAASCQFIVPSRALSRLS